VGAPAVTAASAAEIEPLFDAAVTALLGREEDHFGTPRPEGDREDGWVPRPEDRRRSLEDLDGERWGAAPLGATRLVAEVHRLRRKPLGELTVEDLRLLIAQGIALPRLVPLALEFVRDEPLVAGDLYEGDLLTAVLRVDGSFWRRHRDLADELSRALDRVADVPSEVSAGIERFRGSLR
jgi:hypothetical protein